MIVSYCDKKDTINLHKAHSRFNVICRQIKTLQNMFAMVPFETDKLFKMCDQSLLSFIRNSWQLKQIKIRKKAMNYMDVDSVRSSTQ